MGIKEKTATGLKTSSKEDDLHDLILFNDDFNTFNYVIEALVEVCGHDLMQAENCALIAHYKGKCPVKKGTFSLLSTMKRELDFRDLTAEVV